MYDSVVMEIFEGQSDLVQIALCLNFSYPLPSLDELVECLMGAELEKDVDIVLVFEEVLEPNNILILQGLVDFDLRCELGK